MKDTLLTSHARLTLLAVLAFTLTLGACRKNADSAADDSISAQDHANMNTALNSTTDDATNIAGNIPAIAGKTDATFNVCNATIDSSQKASGIITVTFNGAACNNNILRTGTLTLTLQNYANGTRWKDAGAVLQVVFNDVNVTNSATGNSIKINGTHYLTNITGGLAWKVISGLENGPVTHKHTSSNFSIEFADQTVRTWSVNRLRTFSNTGGIATISVSGDTTINSNTNVDAWGTNRNGNDFVNAITTPITANATCGWYKPVSGEFAHHIANRSIDIVYGVTSLGDPSTTGCAYGYKVVYTVSNNTRTKVFPYWY